MVSRISLLDAFIWQEEETRLILPKLSHHQCIPSFYSCNSRPLCPCHVPVVVVVLLHVGEHEHGELGEPLRLVHGGAGLDVRPDAPALLLQEPHLVLLLERLQGVGVVGGAGGSEKSNLKQGRGRT